MRAVLQSPWRPMGTPSSISLHACWRARGNPADLAEGLVCFLVLHSLSRQVGAGLSTSLVRAPGRFPFMMLSYKPKSSHVTVDWVGTETRAIGMRSTALPRISCRSRIWCRVHRSGTGSRHRTWGLVTREASAVLLLWAENVPPKFLC